MNDRLKYQLDVYHLGNHISQSHCLFQVHCHFDVQFRFF
jgi:hypothetical protein